MKKLIQQIADMEELAQTEGDDSVLTREKITEGIKSGILTDRLILRAILNDPERESAKADLVLELLQNEVFQSNLENGRITYGMVKPAVNIPKYPHLTDDLVAGMVIRSIRSPLQILVSQHTFMPADAVENLYSHLKGLGVGIYERVSKFMISGAVTGLILFSPTKDAIAEWRKQMGPTDPVKPDADGEFDQTIRHQFATRIENNIVHGSDSIESVRHELNIFKRLLPLNK